MAESCGTFVMDVPALQECVAGLTAAVRPLQDSLAELERTGRSGAVPREGTSLRDALAQEAATLDQQRKRCQWLQRQRNILQRSVEWRERLTSSLMDDALLIKEALVDVTLLILPQNHQQQKAGAEGKGARQPEPPETVAEAGMALLNVLAKRCKGCWSHHMDLRAGNLEPMVDFFCTKRHSLGLDAEVNLASSEQEVDDGLLRFPHFLLSLSRGIDKLIEALKPVSESTTDQLFLVYSAQLNSILKKHAAKEKEKATGELASAKTATASALRALAEFLDSLAEKIHDLLSLTGAVFGLQGPLGEEIPGCLDLLSARYDVSERTTSNFVQAISDTVGGAVLPLLRTLMAKPAPTQSSALSFSLDLLKKLIAFYGGAYGPLYFTLVALRDGKDSEQLAKRTLIVIEDQQPLKDVVSAVLKSMKLAVEDQPTLDEFTSRQVWSQDKDALQTTKAIIELFEVCSVVAALSRHTPYRTKSEAMLAQILTTIVNAGQQTKSSGTRSATSKFSQYLQRKDVPSGIGSSPNFITAQAKTFYALCMPSILSSLQSASASSSSAQMKPERSLLV